MTSWPRRGRCQGFFDESIQALGLKANGVKLFKNLMPSFILRTTLGLVVIQRRAGPFQGEGLILLYSLLFCYISYNFLNYKEASFVYVSLCSQLGLVDSEAMILMFKIVRAPKIS